MARPNFLFILADQHRAVSTGCYGRTDARTPHLDALAAESVLFENAYCQYPISTASRQSLLTGQYPGRNGSYQNLARLIDPGQWTLPGALARAGYQTALIGKAHCNTAGFLHRRVYQEWADEVWPRELPGAARPPHFGLDYRRNAETVGPWPHDERYGDTAFVTREALEFLRRRRPGRPFMALLSYERPHPPFLVPQRFLDRFDADRLELPPRDPNLPPNPHWGAELLTDDRIRNYLRGYYAALAQVDEAVGRILEHVRSAGLLDDTVILYTSDHGEAGGCHNKYEKHSFFDPEVRVPLLIRAPGTAPRRVAELVELVDLAPTLLDMAGAGADRPTVLDGQSLAGLLAGRAAGWKNRAVCENYWPERTLRDGRRMPEEYGRMLLRDGWKCCVGGNMPYPHCLFHLVKDPNELTNRWDDPACRDRRDALLRELHADWIRRPVAAEAAGRQ